MNPDILAVRRDRRVILRPLSVAGGMFLSEGGEQRLLFEPVEFLEKLAALTPRPEINLAVYSRGVGPARELAAWRRRLPPDRR